ncbi:hypothetical protein F5B22DRAFT_617985 [Xylaria bambusicola]|uniref:uncharacterized protein n=1 Tax=Xylaria bambusicola TaxID=326684 RepID=UPI0020073771|nr:uncharacterized protein F5B22DRAFT_617985 [Xylaria bambusicola]KAI0509182.1 hypothetical protein F5B22DRAFT_617985 [Xylaria bambusicola]
MHYTTTSTTLIGLALWSSAASAVCTGWDHDRIVIDDAYGFSNHQTQALDNMICPADSQSSCHFSPRTYDITAERTLESGIHTLDLPEDETDAIFKLAQDAFNEDVKEPWEFKTIKTNVSSEVEAGTIILEVKPGINKTLLWTSFYGYSIGVLSGCTNETLNNMTVMAGTPHFQKEPRLNNRTVLAGTWGASWPNDDDNAEDDDDDDDSGASPLKSGTTAVWVIATMALAYFF